MTVKARYKTVKARYKEVKARYKTIKARIHILVVDVEAPTLLFFFITRKPRVEWCKNL